MCCRYILLRLIWSVVYVEKGQAAGTFWLSVYIYILHASPYWNNDKTGDWISLLLITNLYNTLRCASAIKCIIYIPWLVLPPASQKEHNYITVFSQTLLSLKKISIFNLLQVWITRLIYIIYFHSIYIWVVNDFDANFYKLITRQGYLNQT
jgi:hypothetical protein